MIEIKFLVEIHVNILTVSNYMTLKRVVAKYKMLILYDDFPIYHRNYILELDHGHVFLDWSQYQQEM